jgi:DNA-binding response OmpR family regulator
LTATDDRLTAAAVLLSVDLTDGFEVLQELRDSGVTARTAVLTHSAQVEATRTIALGATDHLMRPFSVSQLVEKLRRTMEGRV